LTQQKNFLPLQTSQSATAQRPRISPHSIAVPDTEADGALSSWLAALTAVARMRQHAMRETKRRRWLTSINIAIGIKEICNEWEKKLDKIPVADADDRHRDFA